MVCQMPKMGKNPPQIFSDIQEKLHLSSKQALLYTQSYIAPFTLDITANVLPIVDGESEYLINLLISAY
ncbi:MAG: hypothetical protein CVU70_01410 [Deltaproteobacteria bacterium HGW-Deltaproteobacteria-5]|nr:MAG: hypothetical protein CVU70_01410 [Deltaproteobacteria bacterium HGW-Deltaproteobacteria-5]